jgi:glycosyltransferase involved in cell wall biosynthesis
MDRTEDLAGGSGAAARRRLVHVTTTAETLKFLTGQAAVLRARGVDVHAVSSPGPLLDAFGRDEAVPCTAVAMARRPAPLRDLVALARLVRVLRRVRPDVVDAHTPKAGLLAIAAAWLARVPVRIYHLHGLRYATARGPARRLLRTTEWIAAALSTRVLSVSHSVAREAIADGLVPAWKIGVVLGGSIGGVDAQRFRPADEGERRAARQALRLPPDARVIGFVGRLVRDKGVGELAAAWRLLREEDPAARLVVLGPREEGDPLPPAVLAGLAADPRVVLAGVDWDTPRYFAAMDVVTLPSYREGFPVVPLEAAAMALPVVATRVAGCVDAVVDGVTGALVPPGDVGALRAALAAYLGDPERRRRHGEAARARVLREFDRRRIWEALAGEYARAARDGATPGPRSSPAGA